VESTSSWRLNESETPRCMHTKSTYASSHATSGSGRFRTVNKAYPGWMVFRKDRSPKIKSFTLHQGNRLQYLRVLDRQSGVSGSPSTPLFGSSPAFDTPALLVAVFLFPFILTLILTISIVITCLILKLSMPGLSSIQRS